MKVSYDLKFEKFLNLWSKAEKEKDKKAQYKLALLYFKHNNSDTSVYAFKLFKKSAKQGLQMPHICWRDVITRVWEYAEITEAL